jgi:translocation and assembly module TamB
MDDAAIASLIATGRTDANLNTSSGTTAGASTGAGAVTAQEAGAAMATALVSAAFSGIVSEVLPVDQFSIETSTVRAGKYLTDKLYVGYARRFDAKPEDGENANEMTAQYRVSRRWHFEVRYGDAQAGDASMFWSTDY